MQPYVGAVERHQKAIDAVEHADQSEDREHERGAARVVLRAHSAAAHAARVGGKAPRAHREMNRGEGRINRKKACKRARHQAERAETEVRKSEDECEAAGGHGGSQGVSTPPPSPS